MLEENPLEKLDNVPDDEPMVEVEVGTTEELAVKLEYHIRKYIPKFWKESIETVCFVPSVMPSDYESLRKGESLPRFDKWYFKEAIVNYFLIYGRDK